MTLTADAFTAGFERGALRGKSWRAQDLGFHGPLDLLLALKPDHRETPALRLISDQLVARENAVHAEENPQFLAVSMGPQEGKSTLIAWAYPLWLWLMDPDLRILIISYDNETSHRWGRDIKEALENFAGEGALRGIDLHLSLRPGSKAVSRLKLDGHQGSVSCMSLTGGIAGKPGDRIILDDLVKDRETAKSGWFKRVWRAQWQSNIVPRLGPRCMVAMDHTRWTEDDPIGQQTSENGAAWIYLNIPAKVETPKKKLRPGEQPTPPMKDPLGRQEGEWLESARGRTPEQWEKKRRDVGEDEFAALYQGMPAPAEGGLFKREDVRFWQATGDRWAIRIPGRQGPDELIDDLRNPTGTFRFITVDLAASLKTSADYSVAAAWAIAGTGELIMLDLRRMKVDPKEHWEKVVQPLQSLWQCPVYVEQSMHTIDLVYSATRAGAVVRPLQADSDKYTRAVPAASRMGKQIFFPPTAHWWPDFEDELMLFPGGGAHDDQVDVLSYAWRVRSAYWVPPAQSEPPPPAPDASMVALGGGVDIGSTPL